MMFSIRIKLFFSLLFCQFFISSAFSQQKENLLVRTFHFDNLGLDKVKLKSLDIKTPAVQKEIHNIVTTIVRNLDPGFYTNLLTKTGNKDYFIGGDVANQWYKEIGAFREIIRFFKFLLFVR